MTEFVTRP
ncbi:hypothetical protein YPPY96_1567, partial [Yersinia pestis PY-96]